MARTASSVVTARMRRFEASDSPPTKNWSGGCSPAWTCVVETGGQHQPGVEVVVADQLRQLFLVTDGAQLDAFDVSHGHRDL